MQVAKSQCLFRTMDLCKRETLRTMTGTPGKSSLWILQNFQMNKIENMKKDKLIFWTITILFSVFMLFSAIPDILMIPDAVAFMNHLGYPNYIILFIGVAKVVGIIAILIPKFKRI